MKTKKGQVGETEERISKEERKRVEKETKKGMR
jgi:hypothetical protein